MVTGGAEEVRVGTNGNGNVISGSGIGVLVHHAPDVKVMENAMGPVSGSESVPANLVGVLARGPDGLKVGTGTAGNAISAKLGVAVVGGNDIDLIGNTLRRQGTSPYGLTVQDARDVRIGGSGNARNFVHGHIFGIRSFRNADVEVLGNDVFNAALGIEVVQSKRVRVEGANLNKNDVGLAVQPVKSQDPRYPTKRTTDGDDENAEIFAQARVQTALASAQDFFEAAPVTPGDDAVASKIDILDNKIHQGDVGAMVSWRASRVKFGSQAEADENIIVNNDSTGLLIAGKFKEADRVQILRNQIRDNGGDPKSGVDGLNVDVGSDKNLTPFGMPRIKKAKENGNRVDLEGTLDAKPSTRYRIDIYKGPCGPHGQGDALNFVDSFQRVTNGSGKTTFDVRVPFGVRFSALATPTTANDGSSGELSLCKEAS
jgi:hypothetical protein